jgi:hypothetical protein
MVRKVNDFTRGFEHLLNHPTTNPFGGNGSAPMKAVFTASELPLTEAMKYIGKQKKTPKVKEADKSKERIEKLEAETTE